MLIISELLLAYPEDSWNLSLVLKTNAVQLLQKAFNSAVKCRDAQKENFPEVRSLT